MSVTAPMHWTMVPCACAIAFFPETFDSNGVLEAASSDRRGAADDLGQFLGDRCLARLVVDQRQLVDDVGGVVGGGLHRHHARRLLARHVLGHGLVDDRLDVAREDLVEHALGFGLVDVVPGALGHAEPLAGQRQQLLHHRLLLHGVDELRVEDHQAVEAVLGVAVEHDLDRADQPLHVRPVAELRDLRHDVRAEALHERQALVADAADLEALALGLPLLHLVEHEPQDVGVQAAAQALVGGDDDDADLLHRVALDQERVPVLGIGVRDVRGDVADLLGVGARGAHAVLRLAHLRGGDHLHRLGDLPSVLHTLDLGADLFRACHVVGSLAYAGSASYLVAAVLLPVVDRRAQRLLVVGVQVLLRLDAVHQLRRTWP